MFDSVNDLLFHKWDESFIERMKSLNDQVCTQQNIAYLLILLGPKKAKFEWEPDIISLTRIPTLGKHIFAIILCLNTIIVIEPTTQQKAELATTN